VDLQPPRALFTGDDVHGGRERGDGHLGGGGGVWLVIGW
jgi:hypothetical protein